MNFEEEYIKQTYNFLGHEKETNLRLIDPKKILPPQNYFAKNENQFIEVCKKFAGTYNIYAGINERSAQGTTSKEVVSVKTIVIDLDPIRFNAPLGKEDASTEEELKETEKVADQIINDFEELEFNPPVKCLSGNGVQLWFAFKKIEINDTNRQEIENKVKLFNENLKKKYETEKVKIDQIGDLARIIKVMGTLSIKGNNTQKRPYRIAKPLMSFERKEDTKFLENLLKLQPKQTNPEQTERKIKLSTWEILKLKNPTSAERGSLIMQLKEGNNWNEDQIIEHIAKNNKWENYDPIKTREGIIVFFKSYADKPNPRKQGQEEGYFGITETNPKAKFELKKCLGYGYHRQKSGYVVKPEIKYKIFSLQFGTGHNKTFYAITKPYEQKPLGYNETCLRPLLINKDEEGKEKIEDLSYCYPEKNVLLAICKDQKISTKIQEAKGEETITREATFEELLNKIIERHKEDEIFYKETPTISKKKIQGLKQEDWEKIIKDFIFEGINKDPIIELIYKSDLIQPNPEKIINARQYQPKNSHELVFTNSKTTKTSTAIKTGKLLNSARLSNLLGFATANEKIEGSLNNETAQITIDEIQEDTGEELFSLLSNYLEFGEAETRKGKAIVKVRGFAGLRWQGNPKINVETEKQNNNLTDWEDQEKLYQHFVDCLRIISRNNEAFGGRIALIVFRTDLISKEEFETENALKQKELDINEAIVKTILSEARDNFTDLYNDQIIIDWLSAPCSKEYKETLKQIEEEAPLQPIKDFVRGHQELANSHLRGKAFKLACVDFAPSIMNNTTNKNDLLTKAEGYVSQIEGQNITSLSNLIGVSKNEKTQVVFIKKAFEGLSEHLKIILKGLIEYIKANPEQNKPHFDAVSLFFDNAFYSKTKIKERSTKNMSKTNNLLKRFGVELTGDENEPYIYIQNKKLLEYIENE